MRASEIPFARPLEDRDERAIEREYDRERARREARRRLDDEARADLIPPEVLTLRERLARPRLATTWLIDRWQPAGSRVMLAAAYKAGKTSIVAELARVLVDGGEFLGVDSVRPILGTLAIIDTEMSAIQLDDWLRAQQIRHDDRVLVVPLRGAVSAFNLLDARVLADWAARLKERRVEYLILDCLRPVLDVLGLDEHRETGRLLVAFDALLAEAGIQNALCVHHMGHVGERTRGDSRLRDWPDAEWRLVRKDETPTSQRFIAAFGRDVDVPESALDWDAAARRLTLAGGSRRDLTHRAALDDVLAILRASGPLSGRAVKSALLDSEHPRDVVEAALRLGVQQGTLTRRQGLRRAQLYAVSECPAVSRECPPDTGSECPAAFIEGGHSGHTQPVEEPQQVRTLNQPPMGMSPEAWTRHHRKAAAV